MGVQGERRWPSIFSCFSGCQKSPLSSFRANKKTVPMDATTESNVAEKINEHASNKIKKRIKPSKVSNTRKGCFNRLHKDKRGSHITRGPHKSATCHVASTCNAQIQAAPPLQVAPAQKETGTDEKSATSTKPMPSPEALKTHRNDKRKRVKTVNVTNGLVVLAVILVTLLLGGRVVAIVCTSAWFYVLACSRANDHDDEVGEKYQVLFRRVCA